MFLEDHGKLSSGADGANKNITQTQKGAGVTEKYYTQVKGSYSNRKKRGLITQVFSI